MVGGKSEDEDENPMDTASIEESGSESIGNDRPTQRSLRSRGRKNNISFKTKLGKPKQVKITNNVKEVIKKNVQSNPVDTPMKQTAINTHESNEHVTEPPIVDKSNSNVNNNITSNPEINKNNSNNKYKITDPGPFYIYVDNIERKRMHPMAIGKAIYNSSFDLKNDITEIKQIGYARIRIQANNYHTANILSSLNILNIHPLQSYIPNYLTHRQGVIRNIDINENELDLLDIIKCETKVVAIRRMTKRIVVDGQAQIKKLGTCIVKFEGQSLPEYVYIWSTRCAVTPYVFPVVQCYKCLRLGHLSKQCKGTQRCRNCGGDHDVKECDNVSKLYCSLCNKEGHNSTDKQCPEYKKAVQIKQSMAYSGFSYEDSKEYVQQSTSYAEVLNKPVNIRSEFPTLPPKTNERKHFNITQIRKPNVQNLVPKNNTNITPPQDLFFNYNSKHSAPVFLPNNKEINNETNYIDEIRNIIINTVCEIISQILPIDSKAFTVEAIKKIVNEKTKTIASNSPNNYYPQKR